MSTDKKLQANRRERKELARRLRSQDPGLEVMHPDAAGIDVGNGAHYVAVRPDRFSSWDIFCFRYRAQLRRGARVSAGSSFTR
jgi:hypothetical protein